MPTLSPDSKPVRDYYASLKRYESVGAAHEQAVRTAFHSVLQTAAGKDWTLVPEFTPQGKRIRYDGALRNDYNITLGYWEAKDSADNLDREIQRKIQKGYSLRNTIFQSPQRAVLYQDGRIKLDADLRDPHRLVEVLDLFHRYQEPQIERFHDAVREFRAAIPDLARGLLLKIKREEKSNEAFQHAFVDLLSLCKEAINANISPEAVEEMLIQHLLTERLIRTVFSYPDFGRRNVIATEIENVVDKLTSQNFSRTEFLGQLDRFYRAIEETAAGIDDWSEKQDFLNKVYEQFFQGFSERVADTHGIVYTPQPLVDFMVRSADALLQRHFGQRLADPGVHVLDPFVGTGNFIVRVIEEIPAPALPAKYEAERDPDSGEVIRPGELHANEVMLLPYYVTSLNVEHAYREKTGRYRPFEGIVLVDTFEMVEGRTAGMFSAENSERAQRQRSAPIKVIIGNPPYNAHQVNANDANQNRKYPHIDGRISETYAAASSATLKNKLYDPYVRAFRWASDRIGDSGVIALVTNGSFLEKNTFDGMRRHLAGEFDEVYVVNLGGSVVDNPTLSGTTHNVFGIQVGVAIAFLVRTSGRRPAEDGRAVIRYAEAGHTWKKAQKYDWLNQAANLFGLEWRELQPNARHDWLTGDLAEDWDELIPVGSRDEKSSDEENKTTILDEFCPGVSTTRDAWVFDFDRSQLAERIERFVDTYNAQVVKWQRKGGATRRLADVVTHNDAEIKWSSGLKRSLESGNFADYEDDRFRRAMYRPFVSKWLYYDSMLVERPSLWREYFPTPESENLVLCVTDRGSQKPFMTLMVDRIADNHVVGAGASAQCIPFYIYHSDGSRRENLTDWALDQFRERYGGEMGEAITKWDVFHYVYAVLHHPDYRARYAADLKRSLPRLPFAPSFGPLAEAGRELAELHVGYETAPEYPLKLESNDLFAREAYSFEKMRLDEEAGALRLNQAITLTGIPAEAHRYRLANRSALEWLVDQLRVKTDKRSGIVHDPNAILDEDGEIVSLFQRVVHVSVETVRIVENLPDLGLPND